MGLFSIFRISQMMKTQEPVFIIGFARSGTSLLYRILQKHTLYRTNRMNLVESRIFDYSNKAFYFRGEYPKSCFRYYGGNYEVYSKFLKSIFFIKILHKITIKFLSKVKLSEKINTFFWYLSSNHLFFRLYFYWAKEARGCHGIVEKTPTNIKYLDIIKRAFPQSRFICIYRHPIDVYSSYRKRYLKEQSKWLNIDVKTFCKRYEAEILLADSYNKKMNRFIMLKYEDLVKYPEATFKSICKYLNIPYEKNALSSEQTLSNWSIDPYLSKSITQNTKDWRKYLNTVEVSQIYINLEKIMQMFNYSQY